MLKSKSIYNQSNEIDRADMPVMAFNVVNSPSKTPPDEGSKYNNMAGGKSNRFTHIQNLRSKQLGQNPIFNGYNPKKNSTARHSSLESAVKTNGIRNVYYNFYLRAHDETHPQTKQTMDSDIMYLKHLFRTKYKQLGGNYTESETDSSDVEINLINLLENKSTDIHKYAHKQQCDSSGNCTATNSVYEKHNVNGQKIVFYTLGIDDAEQVHELDVKYLNADHGAIDQVKTRLIANAGLFIGIKSYDDTDEKLQGYCQYAISDSTVTIRWFCANKTFGTPLYKFLEKFFWLSGFKKINLTEKTANAKIDFWKKMGFEPSDPQSKKVFMTKLIKF